MDTKKEHKSITEVADELRLEAYVIRYWETQFIQLKPLRHLGKRLYSASDVNFLLKIKDLLYNKGYTIKGAKQYLNGTNNLQLKKILLELQKLANLIEHIINRNVA